MYTTRSRAIAVLAVVMSVSACGKDSAGPSVGPWLGEWVQVNFLSLDDGGVWDADDPSGIGFVARVTEREWVLTDDYGAGCSITMSYSVTGARRFTRQATSLSSNCPPYPLELLRESGRLEFSDADRVMIENFDLQSGDDIVAYKWVRR